jgi:hypothetical protein
MWVVIRTSIVFLKMFTPGYTAINQIFRVVNEQSQSNFDADFNWVSFYNWTGRSGSLSPPVNNAGAGEPRAFTGALTFRLEATRMTNATL